LNQLVLLALEMQHNCLQQCILVPSNYARSAFLWVLSWVWWTHHWVLKSRCSQEVLPLFVVGCCSLIKDLLNRCSCEIMEDFLGVACLYPFIARVELSPSLLQDENPNFIVNWFREGRLIVHEGDVVININGHPFSLIEHFHWVKSFVIDLIGVE
jgi:hypothetical protein